MTEKRFALEEDCDWWGITDNQLPKTKFGFREDLPEPYLECDYRYNDLTHQEVVDLLNELNDENKDLKKENQELKQKVKSMAKELCNCEEDYIYEEF